MRKLSVILAAVASCVVFGEAETEKAVETDGLKPAALDFMKVEAFANIDSKYLSWGFCDNNEPILTYGGAMSFFDWTSIGVYTLYDVTRRGRRAGYGDRAWRYIELHPNATVFHEFSADEYDWLPTTVAFSLNYDYEYHPRTCTGNHPHHGDYQWWAFEAELPDLWVAPRFRYEREALQDDGTYLNLKLSHSFDIVEDTLALIPSISQGWGNAQRVAGVARCSDGTPRHRPAMMDSQLRLTLEWTPVENVSISVYAAYSDFLFDDGLRASARRYEATGDWERSWHFFGGGGVTVSF